MSSLTHFFYFWSKFYFRLIGRPACPVADFNDATHRTSIHSVQKGNVIYEFVDLPGVPDTISPDGVGEYTFRRKNILKAKKNQFGNHSLFQSLGFSNAFLFKIKFSIRKFRFLTKISVFDQEICNSLRKNIFSKSRF